MTVRSEFLSCLEKISVYKYGERTAPHKPLYMLFCIASIQAGNPRLQFFRDIKQDLSSALQLFGKNGGNPHYPFWRLQNDKLAEVYSDGPLEIRKSNSDPNVSSLLKQNAKGGLIEKYYNLLFEDQELQNISIRRLLDLHFPPSIHDEIIRFFDLKIADRHFSCAKTTSEFQEMVVNAYAGKCAISDFSLEYKDKYFGVEAAHIFWPQSGGNDHIANGIAMSTLHRKLYHLGFIGITDDYEIIISPHIKSSLNSDASINKLRGKKIRLPLKEIDKPSLQSLAWHRKWIFKD